MTTRSLPAGVRITKGYVQVRITRGGQTYTKNFGQDSPLAREFAAIHAADKRKEMIKEGLMGIIGIAPAAPAVKFADAKETFYRIHYEQYKDPGTHQPRTDGSKRCTRDELKVLGKFFDKFYLHEITVSDVKEYKALRVDTNQVAYATFNRERGVLYSIFAQFTRWVSEGVIKPVKLPLTNPVAAVPTLTANKRSRVPDTWELAAAYTWCQSNDAELWDGIEKALLTALRKQDLIALDGSLTVKGIQQKTGEKFDLPITLDKPVNLINYRKRWDAMRKALGWATVDTPKHTTWHDLRHWAPTLLGEKGFSMKIIQSYLGHSSEISAERYTNVRQQSLMPAVDVVKRELDRIKEGK